MAVVREAHELRAHSQNSAIVSITKADAEVAQHHGLAQSNETLVELMHELEGHAAKSAGHVPDPPAVERYRVLRPATADGDYTQPLAKLHSLLRAAKGKDEDPLRMVHALADVEVCLYFWGGDAICSDVFFRVVCGFFSWCC